MVTAEKNNISPLNDKGWRITRWPVEKLHILAKTATSTVSADATATTTAITAYDVRALTDNYKIPFIG